MLSSLLVLVLSAVVASEPDGCNRCENNPVKCVGLGSFCVGDDYTYDPLNPCVRPPGWSHCPICKGPNTVCEDYVCKKRTSKENEICCEQGSCDPAVYCEEGLVCSGREGLGESTCIPTIETATAGGEGNFAAAGENCESLEQGDACGGPNLECTGKCLFVLPVDAELAQGSDSTGHCLEDGDCPGGQYCPSNLTHAFLCQDGHEALRRSGSGDKLPTAGKECLTNMHCGPEYVCESENPFDPHPEGIKICRKMFSRELNEPCNSWSDCKSGLYCNTAPAGKAQLIQRYGAGANGYCEAYPSCLGVDPKSNSCTMYNGDAIDYACNRNRGLRSSRGNQYCTFSTVGAGSQLLIADLTEEYTASLIKYTSCLQGKGCQVFSDDPFSARTIYSQCSRQNCLSIINGYVKELNRRQTCSEFSTTASTLTASAAVTLAPKMISILAAVILSLLLR